MAVLMSEIDLTSVNEYFLVNIVSRNCLKAEAQKRIWHWIQAY